MTGQHYTRPLTPEEAGVPPEDRINENIRDKMALAAAACVIRVHAQGTLTEEFTNTVAAWSYKFADAMLAARKVKK